MCRLPAGSEFTADLESISHLQMISDGLDSVPVPPVYREPCSLQVHRLAIANACIRKTRRLTDESLTPNGALQMVKRRAIEAGLGKEICCHTFRATGITAFLANKGELAIAQRIAGHESPRTTSLYNRSREELSQDEIERILI